ncbi:hypothetical protein QUB63_04855 [Microcoleus sp. ARI1-B5]|uniref:hypothetical protein n=1 Tax=unclassified Microcoleus TaxID=2642155 RepID=UPI002FD32148
MCYSVDRFQNWIPLVAGGDLSDLSSNSDLSLNITLYFKCICSIAAWDYQIVARHKVESTYAELDRDCD